MKVSSRSQILTSSSEAEPEELTEVVYFDVWSDCVVGRSLTGIVICLGDWATTHIHTMRERTERREEGRKQPIKTTTGLNVHVRHH